MKKSKKEEELTQDQKVIMTEYSDEMKKSFLDYSMSVIISRAIPDVRDGLKPVHRRILYTMNENGLSSNKPYKKCADTVGSVLGRYHPHGDSSVYDAMVVMAQDWKKTLPFVDGHGNFGSIEGDPPAAYRYTEGRLTKYSEETLLNDLNHSTVDYIPNFDGGRMEPSILPAIVPNVLVEGTEGIAVGMTTSTPPHNLKEIMLGYKAYIANPKIPLKDLMKIVKGPDFPTGGIVTNKNDLEEIYATGKGKIKIRGKISFVKATKRGEKDALIISEIPYTMIGSGISKFLEDVATLVKDKKLPEISDILNQSSRDGIKLVIELKNGADPERVENILYKKTKLEDTFGVNMLYVCNGRPETMSLISIYKNFYDFQVETKIKKYKALAEKEKEKIEIQDGLIKAIDVIDLIIEIIRGSKTAKIAKDCLMGKSVANIKFKSKKSESLALKLKFSDLQAQSILDMKLSRLIGLELNALLNENDESKKALAKYQKLIKSKATMKELISSECDAVIEKYSARRKTIITNAEIKEVVLDTFEEKDVAIIIDKFFYVKMVDIPSDESVMDSYIKENRRVLICKNTDSVCLFTDTGNVHQIKCDDIPYLKYKEKGTPLDNISGFVGSDEELLYVMAKGCFDNTKLLFLTSSGLGKIVPASEFITNRKTIAATKLSNNDKLIFITNKIENQIAMLTKGSFVIRFNVCDIPELKKNSLGVKCMKLKDDDFVLYANIINQKKDTCVVFGNVTTPVSKIKNGKRAGTGNKIKI